LRGRGVSSYRIVECFFVGLQQRRASFGGCELLGGRGTRARLIALQQHELFPRLGKRILPVSVGKWQNTSSAASPAIQAFIAGSFDQERPYELISSMMYILAWFHTKKTSPASS
jgi:hypothetical protein